MKMNINKFLVIVILFSIMLPLPNHASAQDEDENLRNETRVGEYLENMGVRISYNDPSDSSKSFNDFPALRHKNFYYEIEKPGKRCIHLYLRFSSDNKLYFNALNMPQCLTVYHDEYMWAPTEIIYIGDEYAPAMEYFELAIRNKIHEKNMGEVAIGYLKIGFLTFLGIHFPEHKEFYDAQLPEPTPTPTLTPTQTSTQTSTSTPTPTYTLTPTSTSTSTPTSTLTPNPTVTPTPTQTTLLIMTSNYINDLQAGENNYLIVLIVLIILLVFIGIGVIINKRFRRKETIR